MKKFMLEWLKARFDVLDVVYSVSKKVNRYESAIVLLHKNKYIITNLLDSDEYTIQTMDASFTKKIKGDDEFKKYMLESLK